MAQAQTISCRQFLPNPADEQLMELLRTPPLVNVDQFRRTHWREYQWDAQEEDLWETTAGAYNAAIEAYQANDLQEAIECDEAAIELIPRFAEPHMHLAVIYQKTQDWRKCKQTVERAMHCVQEEVPDLHFCLGRAFYAEGNLGDAVSEFQKEIAIGGPNYNVLRWLIQAFDDQLEPIFRQKNDWGNRFQIRRLTGCAIVCGFRASAMNFDSRFAAHLCQLWDDFERTGGWTLEGLQAMTGISMNEFKGFYRSYGGR